MQNYCLLIGDRSFSNFQKILDLKGTPRGDQQKLLDIFLSVTSTKDDLQDTSFMTSIDMDPSSNDHGHGNKPSGQSSTSTSAFPPTVGSATGLPSLLSRNNSQSQGEGADGGRETPKAFGEFRRLVSFATRRDG